MRSSILRPSWDTMDPAFLLPSESQILIQALIPYLGETCDYDMTSEDLSNLKHTFMNLQLAQLSSINLASETEIDVASLTSCFKLRYVSQNGTTQLSKSKAELLFSTLFQLQNLLYSVGALPEGALAVLSADYIDVVLSLFIQFENPNHGAVFMEQAPETMESVLRAMQALSEEEFRRRQTDLSALLSFVASNYLAMDVEHSSSVVAEILALGLGMSESDDQRIEAGLRPEQALVLNLHIWDTGSIISDYCANTANELVCLPSIRRGLMQLLESSVSLLPGCLPDVTIIDGLNIVSAAAHDGEQADVQLCQDSIKALFAVYTNNKQKSVCAHLELSDITTESAANSTYRVHQSSGSSWENCTKSVPNSAEELFSLCESYSISATPVQLSACMEPFFQGGYDLTVQQVDVFWQRTLAMISRYEDVELESILGEIFASRFSNKVSSIVVLPGLSSSNAKRLSPAARMLQDLVPLIVDIPRAVEVEQSTPDYCGLIVKRSLANFSSGLSSTILERCQITSVDFDLPEIPDLGSEALGFSSTSSELRAVTVSVVEHDTRKSFAEKQNGVLPTSVITIELSREAERSVALSKPLALTFRVPSAVEGMEESSRQLVSSATQLGLMPFNHGGISSVEYMMGAVPQAVLRTTAGDEDIVRGGLEFENKTYLVNISAECVFFNTSAEEWQSEGCLTMVVNGSVQCECFHLTSFSVLLRLDADSDDGMSSSSSADAVALSMITLIGLSVSIVCLVASLVAFAVLRGSKYFGFRQMITAQMVVALIVAQLLFVVGIRATEQLSLCQFVAAMQHYVWLCVFFFTMCEAHHAYGCFVRVFGSSYGDEARMKAYVFLGWVVPVFIVMTAYASTPGDYGTERVCWIDIGSGAMYAFVVPLVVVLVVNLYVMVRAAISISRAQERELGLRAFVALFFLLGMTWVFGLFVVAWPRVVTFEYLFSICTSVQGVYVFVIQVYIGPERRAFIVSQLLRRKASSLTAQEHTHTSTSSGFKLKVVGGRMAKMNQRRQQEALKGHNNVYNNCNIPQPTPAADQHRSYMIPSHPSRSNRNTETQIELDQLQFVPSGQEALRQLRGQIQEKWSQLPTTVSGSKLYSMRESNTSTV